MVKNMIFVLFAILIAAADQCIKLLLVANADKLPVMIDGLVRFILVRNQGAAFSLFQGARWFFIAFTAFAQVVIYYLIFSKKITHPMGLVSLAMISGGSIGNLIDRVYLGYVVDYIQLEFVNFAVFNFADCFITIGCLMFAAYILFFEARRPAVEKTDDNQD